ncbi:MAG: GreA/GreB family elongation factor [Bacteroidetes bacterium]|nr:GreA/GreB family elongation factor [Bacteroidota bacterium]
MKPIVSESVYKKLYSILQKVKSPEGKQLGMELSKAKVVKDADLKKDIITLNSTIEVQETSLPKPIKLKIVLPDEADLSQMKVSIFAPISIALFGFKESYSFNWLMPSGNKTLKILKVIN